jgi:hypothetical protein
MLVIHQGFSKIVESVPHPATLFLSFLAAAGG